MHFLAAIEFYTAIDSKLAIDFKEEVDQNIRKLELHPCRPAIRKKGFRIINLKRFPYQLIYFVMEQQNEVLVTCICHFKRRPSIKFKLP